MLVFSSSRPEEAPRSGSRHLTLWRLDQCQYSFVKRQRPNVNASALGIVGFREDRRKLVEYDRQMERHTWLSAIDEPSRTFNDSNSTMMMHICTFDVSSGWKCSFASFTNFWIIENKLFKWCDGCNACRYAAYVYFSEMPWHRTEDTFCLTRQKCVYAVYNTKPANHISSQWS